MTQMMLSIDEYPFKTTPLKHQMEELKTSATELSWALFWEMGTGKSKVIIDNIGYLYLNGKIDTAIVIAKKGEYANWVYTQFPAHLPDAIHSEIVLYSTYSARLARGKKALESLLSTEERRLRILVVNIEAMTSAELKKYMVEYYRTSKGVFFVVDESRCVANRTSVRSKEVYKWAAKAHYKRILTGTPNTSRSPIDLWGQSLVLGKQMFGTSSFYAFRDIYVQLETSYIYRAGRQVEIKTHIGARNLPRLTAHMDLWSTRKIKSECLDLPDKIYKPLAVELTSEQVKLYTSLRDEALLEVGDQVLEVTHALTLVTKLHQIACGQLKFEDGSYKSVANNRLQALGDILEEHEGKAIIWANYRQTLQDLVKYLKAEYGDEAVVDYYGGTSDERRKYALEAFQDPNSPVRFFVANPQSAGYGLTLTQADLVVYYSNSYNLEHRLQSEDRAHRIGQTKKVTYVDLYAPGTVDERIMQILRAKKSLADEIMRQPVREWI